ncbi:MAG: hypothetical protein E7J15_09150, partial [Neisseria sp.]|uniref:hypothetical protein n=1 Tax=uncultured Neisseria sp. TaxID=237778 RepID=UPI002638779F
GLLIRWSSVRIAHDPPNMKTCFEKSRFFYILHQTFLHLIPPLLSTSIIFELCHNAVMDATQGITPAPTS